ncbi:hypothetical protein PQ469_22290 [Mucilaginibacter sp. KACC 22773]|uniref:hypothetical protein n=1 Tax=Mucilaginibacter sp. KACC 22773 TaxID=3025671 RepID=UPI0023672667|nr:hypothetical protein [Mucilaginibacter sp. KACC 22773]WDF76620.1 hypothetical protein PQ469_22290 [Mucilaginibacter sp. KACC 22773]
MRFKNLTLAALCLMAALFSFSNVFAQSSVPPTPQFAVRTDLVPPSPNVASLGKYGTVPVSMQTGNPNISIPITEVNGKQLKVPISLSYNNNGFKPAEQASWVGWGWNLNCGGAVTRIVRDKVDEFVSSPYRYDDISWRYTTHDSVTRKFMDQAMFDNYVDTEPDLYSYSFGGYSGKFFFSGGTCHQYPYNQLNISYLSPAEGFVITTPDGTIYTFSMAEHTIAPHNLYAGPNDYQLPTDYISSWHLRTITSADYKDVITFSYSSPVEINQRGPASQGMVKENLLGGGIAYTLNPIGFAFPTRVAAVQLTQITSSKMTVVFNAATARLDLATPQLDNIDIKNYQGTLVNRFKFNYGYFSDPTNSLATHRLKLLGVDEGINPATLKKHSFYYKGGISGTYITTSREFPGVDDWGYSNGPDISETGNMMPNTIHSGGVSKAPSMVYSQQTMLNKIIYPTGGVSVFEYEPNIYNPANGPTYVYNTFNVNNYISRSDTTTTNVITSSSQSFQLLEAQYVKVNWQRIPKDPQGYVGGRLPTDPTKNMTPDVTITGSQTYNFSILVNSDNAGKTDSVLLQPGTYSVYLTCDGKENYVQGSVTYKVKTTQVITGTPGPGLRILRISNYLNSAGIGTPASVKEYSYQDSTGLSTGVLLNIPNYYQGEYSEEQYKTWFPEVHNYMNYTSTNTNPLNVTQDMYYKLVYEKQVNGTDYLLSKSEFIAFGGGWYNDLAVQLIRKTDFKKVSSVYKPIQKQEYVYDQDVTETGIYAGIKPHLSIRRIPCCGVPPSPICGVTEDRLREYTYNNWNTVPSFLRLKSQREVSYVNTSDSVVTSSAFTYSIPYRNKVLASTTDSKGTTRVEKYKYQDSYATGSGSVGIAMVIEKQGWLKRSATDSVMTDGVITDYDNNKPRTLYSFINANPVASLNQETKNAQGLYTSILSDSRYKARITTNYNGTTANVESQDIAGYYPTTTTSHQVAYLWGYHNNYPIAQVKNADLAGVAYTSFEDDDNSWTYTAANVVSNDARTGVKSYNGTISKSSLPSGNYKVSLWGKGSATITIGGVAKTMTGTWTLYEWTLTGITSISISSNGNLIDEVRLCPIGTLMTTYTYLPLTGVSSSTDAKGMSTYFEYDSESRLVNIKDRQGNILKSYDYNYAGQGAVWQDNGTFQCVTNGVGQNTGEQQKQQVDTNPYSPTYNQTQWVSNGTNTTACPLPPTIYVNVSVGSTSVSNGLTYHTYVFKSYSDANCTVAYNVPVTFTINYQYVKNATYNDGRTPNPEVTTTNSTVTISSGTNQGTSGSLLSSGCFTNSSIQICYSSSVTVQTGTGYVPVNIEN